MISWSVMSLRNLLNAQNVCRCYAHMPTPPCGRVGARHDAALHSLAACAVPSLMPTRCARHCVTAHASTHHCARVCVPHCSDPISVRVCHAQTHLMHDAGSPRHLSSAGRTPSSSSTCTRLQALHRCIGCCATAASPAHSPHAFGRPPCAGRWAGRVAFTHLRTHSPRGDRRPPPSSATLLG